MTWVNSRRSRRMPPDPQVLGKIGRLTPVFTALEMGKSGVRESKAACLCDCGSIFKADVAGLKAGRIKSCGCAQIEHIRALGRSRITHGASIRSGTARLGLRMREYRVWMAMLGRCRNKNSPDWKNYGGRGIEVCQRWRDFELFLADMGVRPEGTSLDRRDVNGNYEAANCRWATPAVQARNRRPSKRGWPKHLKCSEPYEIAYGL